MAGAIMRAEADVLEKKIVEAVQNNVDKKDQDDAKALGVVNHLLDADAGVINMPQQQLDEIIFKASPVVKITIFNQAQSFRQQNWKREEDRVKLTRVIPIFKALIASDTEDKYHRNHGQLGYTLKDKIDPDYKTAESELSKAMEIRDKSGKKGRWLLYEFNRAFCRISVNAIENKEVYPKAAIYADIQAASQVSSIQELISKLDLFGEWLKNNA